MRALPVPAPDDVVKDTGGPTGFGFGVGCSADPITPGANAASNESFFRRVY
jgi:hypothetical protein